MRNILLALLFLSGLTYSAHSQLKVTKVTREVNFYHSRLDSVDLQQRDFYNYVNFANAIIKKKTNFFLCKFLSKADFGSTGFWGPVEISNTNFNDLAYFLRANFADQAHFIGTNFNGEAMFEGAEFVKDVHFIADTFKVRAAFLNCRFKGFTEFQQCSFKGKTSFTDSRFYDDVSFKEAAFWGPINFTNAIFYKSLDFSNIQNITNRIDLTVIKTELTPNTKVKRGINLTNTDISKFKLDYSLFYLIFDTTATFEYRSNVYQSLLNNFKNDGYTESYELLDKEYKTFLYNHKQEKFFLWLDKYWWGFGYSKYFIFYWILGFIATFTFINLFFYPYLNKEVYKVGNVKTFYLFRTPKKILSVFYYSLVYTAVLFFSLSVKLENLKYKYWIAVIYIFLIYISGIVCIAYLANFVITK